LRLEGEQFGDWTVKKRLANTKENKSMWLCECKCGKESEVLGSNLATGKSKCCFDCGHKRTVFAKAIPSSWWYKTMDQARTRGIQWDLTEEAALDLLERQEYRCVFTRLPLTFKPMVASLDRIDSAKSYCVDNVQWVHKHINIMKYRYSQDYFVEMCCLVAQNQKLKGKQVCNGNDYLAA